MHFRRKLDEGDVVLMSGTGLELSPEMEPKDILAHYGKLGMRWGHRKNEPTVSVPSSKAAAKTLGEPSRKEQKQEARNERANLMVIQASKMDVRVSEIRAELKALPPGYKSYSDRARLTNDLNENSSQSERLRRSADEVRKGGLTSNQKKMIIGGLAVGLVVGGVYASTKVQSGEFNSMKLRGAALLRGEKFEFAKDPRLSSYKTPGDVLQHVAKPVNPNYGIPGGQMNCRRSTYTYELRRRGYDVQATTSSLGWGQSETGAINALTKGRNISRSSSLSANVASGRGIRAQVAGDMRLNPAEKISLPSAQDRTSVLKALASQPNGARGEIVFDFQGFGHSLAYENFDGKPHIFDSQKGLKYDMSKPDEYSSFLNKWGSPRGVEITRLDNVDLDTTFLSRWATNHQSPAPAVATKPANMSDKMWRALQKGSSKV